MWELIAANRKKSILLFSAMFFILLTLGFFIGYYFLPGEYWYYGILFAILIWAILIGLTLMRGEAIILRLAEAKPASRERFPVLHNVTKEMQIAANLPYCPDVFVIEENAPNAFATGRNPDTACIVVTTGLLAVLTRDELQGVIAHEMSHILNRDVLFMTHASVMLGSIVILSNLYLRGMIYSGGGRSKRRSINRGASTLFILSIMFSLLSPVVANILYFSISKKREYLADASAVRLTRYPFGLMRALQKISNSDYEYKTPNRTLSSFYIADPCAHSRALFDFQTHPPIDKRIEILQALTHDVQYLTYQKIYSKLCGKPGKNTNIIPSSAFRENGNISVIQPSKEQLQENPIPNPQFLMYTYDTKEKTASAGILHHILGIEPETINSAKQTSLPPKTHPDDKAKAIKDENGNPVYYRQTNGWESFACVCGSAKHLSPSYKKNNLFCTACGSDIKIVNYDINRDFSTAMNGQEKNMKKQKIEKMHKKA